MKSIKNLLLLFSVFACLGAQEIFGADHANLLDKGRHFIDENQEALRISGIQSSDNNFVKHCKDFLAPKNDAELQDAKKYLLEDLLGGEKNFKTLFNVVFKAREIRAKNFSYLNFLLSAEDISKYKNIALNMLENFSSNTEVKIKLLFEALLGNAFIVHLQSVAKVGEVESSIETASGDESDGSRSSDVSTLPVVKPASGGAASTEKSPVEPAPVVGKVAPLTESLMERAQRLIDKCDPHLLELVIQLHEAEGEYDAAKKAFEKAHEDSDSDDDWSDEDAKPKKPTVDLAGLEKRMTDLLTPLNEIREAILKLDGILGEDRFNRLATTDVLSDLNKSDQDILNAKRVRARYFESLRFHGAQEIFTYLLQGSKGENKWNSFAQGMETSRACKNREEFLGEKMSAGPAVCSSEMMALFQNKELYGFVDCADCAQKLAAAISIIDKESFSQQLLSNSFKQAIVKMQKALCVNNAEEFKKLWLALSEEQREKIVTTSKLAPIVKPNGGAGAGDQKKVPGKLDMKGINLPGVGGGAASGESPYARFANMLKIGVPKPAVTAKVLAAGLTDEELNAYIAAQDALPKPVEPNPTLLTPPVFDEDAALNLLREANDLADDLVNLLKV